MRKWLLSLLLLLLALAGSAGAQEKIADGRLVLNRWLSWDEVRGGMPPPDAQPIGKPWITETMRPKGGTFRHIAAYWYQLPPLEPGSYQLGLDVLNHGYTAWLWNPAEPERRLLIRAGQEGLTEDTELRAAVKRIVPFTVLTPGPWYLVINFSFVARETGGLWSEPEIAPERILSGRHFIHTSLVFAACGSLLIMIFYMIMMFVRRHEDYPSLFLALMCLGLLLRTLGVEMLLCELFDPIPTSLIYDVSRRVEYLSIGLVNLAMLPFLTTTFQSVACSRRTVLLSSGLSAAYMLSCCLRSLEHVRTDVHWIQILTGINLFYMIRLLILAIKNKEEGARYMLAAATLPLAVFVLEIVHSRLGGNIRLGHFTGTLFVFMQSQLLAKRFASAYHRAAHLSVSLQTEVDRQTSQIRHIMDHIPEGLFIIDRNKTITPPYSTFMQAIFPGTALTEKPVLDLFSQHFQMPAQDVAMVDSILEASLHEDSVNWDLNRDHMMEKFLIAADRTYRVHWHPIESQGKILQFMGIIHDVTELQRLETETREQEEDFRILKEFLLAPKTMTRNFLQKQSRLMELIFQECDHIIDPASIKTVFAYLHTLKGNARQLHLKELSHLCHAAEEPLRLALGQRQRLDPEALRQSLGHLQTTLERYARVFVKFFGQGEEDTFNLFSPSETAQLRSWLEKDMVPTREIRELLGSKLGWDLKEWIEQLGREQLRLAQTLGKSTPDLMIQASRSFECPADLRDALLDALGHLFRNSLAHGFNHEQGTLHVRMEGDGPLERLVIHDDGPGLNVAKIRRKAGELGLITAQQPLSFQQLASMIFAPVFSTAETVSELAGRGMGMNAVQLLLEPFGAVIALEPLDRSLLQRSDLGDLVAVPFCTIITLRPAADAAQAS